MRIAVLLRMAPDVVEEIEIGPEEKGLDLEVVRMILNEADDHALEQALLLKESLGAQITAFALETPDADDVLFTALAKGVDRCVRIACDGEDLSTRAAAEVIARSLRANATSFDLFLTGVQAINDLDGLLAPLLAHHLGLAFAGIITGIRIEGGKCIVTKEFPAGVRAELEVELPAVIGVQSAEKPPRYAPVAKVRGAMKTQRIETADAVIPEELEVPRLEIIQMRKVEPAGQAVMLAGGPERAANDLTAILLRRGLL